MFKHRCSWLLDDFILLIENDDDDSKTDVSSESVDAEEKEHDWWQIDSAMNYMSENSSAEQLNEKRDVSETQSTFITSLKAE